ncbi:MAG: hypothetical protein C4527_21900 [Candidatus Omnitrophota bacterium]|jgi:hypothetical protein|nr:MAG: hypothetical protein C4527_21900 [Candidatus Omnitrophota bacterium]
MTSSVSPFKTDLIVHAVCFLMQFLFLLPGGLAQGGPTPPFVYPFFLILAAITLVRQWESVSVYGTRLILIPCVFSIFLYGFCLINELGGTFWAFYTPRWFPTAVRIVWMQAGLLLIHPRVFIPVHHFLSRFFEQIYEKGYFHRKLPLTLLIIGLLMWLLRSQNISPDGYDWLKHSIFEKNWVRYLREPLGTFVLRLWVLGGIRMFHWDPYISITILGFVCGFIATWFLYGVFQFCMANVHAGYGFALLLSSAGYTQIFVGNIEIYALLQLGLAVFLFAAIRYLRGDSPAWLPGAMFGVLFCLHLSAGWWLPALFLLPYIKTLIVPASTRPIRDLSLLLVSCIAPAFAFGVFVLQYGYGGNIDAMWEHFWSDEVMNVGTDAAMFHAPETFLTPHYYMNMLNEYFYMMPAAFPLLLVLVPAFRRTHRALPHHCWLLVLAGFYLVYTIVWRPDRSFPADWDIFSGLTIPSILLLGVYISHLRLPENAIRFILYQTVVFSGLFLLLQLLRNHFKISDWPLFI